MILESMSHPSFGVDAQLFAGDRLSVLADSDGDLPCSTGAEITLAFAAEFASGTVNDVWTFERNLDSRDPNWVLIATSGDLPE